MVKLRMAQSCLGVGVLVSVLGSVQSAVGDGALEIAESGGDSRTLTSMVSKPSVSPDDMAWLASAFGVETYQVVPSAPWTMEVGETARVVGQTVLSDGTSMSIGDRVLIGDRIGSGLLWTPVMRRRSSPTGQAP